MARRLLLLNALAVLAVILVHSAGWGYTALFWWTDRYVSGATVPDFSQVGSLAYYGLRSIEQLASFGIAAFLFVSGYFISLAAPSDSLLGWRPVGSRISNLLIPYLLWSTVLIAVDYLHSASLPPERLVRTLLTGGAAEGYYYVPMLCQLLLLSPFLLALSRRSWRLVLITAALLAVGIHMVFYARLIGTTISAPIGPLGQPWLFPRYLVWFVLGMIYGLHREAATNWLASKRYVALGAALLLIPVGMLEWELIQAGSGEAFLPTRLTLVDDLYAAAFILAYMGTAGLRLPLPGAISTVGINSYGIYLANIPTLEFTARSVAVLIPSLLSTMLLFQSLLWAAGLTIPVLLIAALGSKQSPLRRFSYLVFG